MIYKKYPGRIIRIIICILSIIHSVYWISLCLHRSQNFLCFWAGLVCTIILKW